MIRQLARFVQTAEEERKLDYSGGQGTGNVSRPVIGRLFAASFGDIEFRASYDYRRWNNV